MTTVSIPSYHYIHVLNLNTNVQHLVMGPKTYICLEHEKMIGKPKKMISVAPTNYCNVMNPVMKEDNKIVIGAEGQVKLRMGVEEYRFHQPSFPLYPGENMIRQPEPLPVVMANTALHLRALFNHTDEEGTERCAQEEWLFEGPGTYYPRVEVEKLKVIKAHMIERNQAIKLKVKRDCVDRNGMRRCSGEEWLVKSVGAYLPTVYEEIVSVVNAQKLDEKTALHVRSLVKHMDQFGVERSCGEEWLVTNKDADSYICDISEEMIKVVLATTLNCNQYCVIVDPVDSKGNPKFGARRLVRGEHTFFLMPGESLENGIQRMYTLGPNDGLILMAKQTCVEAADDESADQHKPGERWLLRGPCEYIPPIGIEVIAKRTAIPLGESEGIYVRNTRTGEIRAVIGSTHMLSEDEEHWDKELPPKVKDLLKQDKVPLIGRDNFREMHKCERKREMQCEMQCESDEESSTMSLEERDPCPAVSLQVPHNAAVQVIDYRDNTARVEFGPVLVLLGPHEQFTMLSLSGSTPKRPHVINSLYLLLGPDFMTDKVQVETADHARLCLQLSYNWQFDTKAARADNLEALKLFSSPDFVGDACKSMASRIRGTVASIKFDNFHRNSARIIRAACLGMDSNNKVRDSFMFTQNNLCMTEVDIQSITPTDEKTRELLAKSVQMAIEITTNSQQAAARHKAAKREQEAKGRLEQQKIADETEAAKGNNKLLQMNMDSLLVEKLGIAKSVALSEAECARIKAEANVAQSRTDSEEKALRLKTELDRQEKLRDLELAHMVAKNECELKQHEAQSKLEVLRFRRMVNAMGQETLALIANSGSIHEVKMLQALGLRSTLITDGITPVNLLTTASGLIGQTMVEDRTHAVTK